MPRPSAARRIICNQLNLNLTQRTLYLNHMRLHRFRPLEDIPQAEIISNLLLPPSTASHSLILPSHMAAKPDTKRSSNRIPRYLHTSLQVIPRRLINSNSRLHTSLTHTSRTLTSRALTNLWHTNSPLTNHLDISPLHTNLQRFDLIALEDGNVEARASSLVD